MNRTLGRFLCRLKGGHLRMRKTAPLRVIEMPVGIDVMCEYYCARCGYTEKRKVYPKRRRARSQKIISQVAVDMAPSLQRLADESKSKDGGQT